MSLSDFIYMIDNLLPGEESSYTFRLDPDGLEGWPWCNVQCSQNRQVGLVEVGIQSQGLIKVTYPSPPLPGLQSGHTPFIMPLCERLWV